MILDERIAKEVADLMYHVAGQVEASIGIVRDGCGPEELLAYKRAVGRVIYALYEDVLEPLYKKHPTLRPPAPD